jgi:hypothetical protein
MKKMIACCGVDCSVCDAHVATRNNDDALRCTTAERWARQLDVPVKPEYINCDGCQQKAGRHLEYCAICGIRSCCLEKQHATCAECDEYVCERLQTGFEFLSEVLEMGPLNTLEARKNLEALQGKR